MTALQLFVPGRLCLFGEHADWAGGYRQNNPDLSPGYCLAVGTTQGITAHAMSGDGHLRVDSHRIGAVSDSFIAPLSVAALEAAASSGNFYAYCAGVAAHMAEHYRVGGITIQTTTMDLPLKKGLSSSAAICVLTARAFNQIYKLDLSVRDEMECAYQGEIKTGSQCGRMDQACAYGQTPVFLTFDGEQMHVETLQPRAPLYLVIVDLKRGKNTKKILRDLNNAFVSDSKMGMAVRDALGRQNARILAQARAALEEGDARALGALMQEAQAIFDQQVTPACPTELSAPKLHAVLADPLVHESSWGGKGVGSQGDGCAQLIARDAEAQQTLMRELPARLNINCLTLNIVAHERIVA